MVTRHWNGLWIIWSGKAIISFLSLFFRKETTNRARCSYGKPPDLVSSIVMLFFFLSFLWFFLDQMLFWNWNEHLYFSKLNEIVGLTKVTIRLIHKKFPREIILQSKIFSIFIDLYVKFYSRKRLHFMFTNHTISLCLCIKNKFWFVIRVFFT